MEPIKSITPTFVLPRQGEGIGEMVGFFISRPISPSQPQFSKEGHRTADGDGKAAITYLTKDFLTTNRFHLFPPPRDA
jgi:hypothetical protein